MKDLLQYTLFNFFKFCCSKSTCEEENSFEIEFPSPVKRERCGGSFHFPTEILYERTHKKQVSFDTILEPIIESP